MLSTYHDFYLHNLASIICPFNEIHYSLDQNLSIRDNYVQNIECKSLSCNSMLHLFGSKSNEIFSTPS